MGDGAPDRDASLEVAGSARPQYARRLIGAALALNAGGVLAAAAIAALVPVGAARGVARLLCGL